MHGNSKKVKGYHCLTESEIERAKFLREKEGFTYQELAQVFNRSYQDMYLLLRERKVKKGKRPTVHRAKLYTDILQLLVKGELNQNQIAKKLNTTRQYVSLVNKDRTNDCKK